MKTKLKELRELIFKCEEVKKDVLELKFGCWVKVKTLTPVGLIPNGLIINKVKYLEDKFEVQYYNAKRQKVVIDNLEIIGRDITLEDVLRALYSSDNCGDIIYEYDSIIEYVGEAREKSIKWQLGKPLQFQSPECINNLINLLK
jgi:hypothetical protein